MRALKVVLVLLVLLSGGCGGGGGGDDPVVGYITINGPDTFQTDQNYIVLSGKSFIPSGSYCYVNQTISFRDIPGVYSITWENLANNSSGTAHIWLFCESEISWDVFGLQSVPLEPGENQIIVTLTTDDGEWQDTISVTQGPDVTPPTVFSWFPEGSNTYIGFIRFTFNEPIDLDSLWDNFTLRNMTTDTLVTGVGSMDNLFPEFLPDTALESNTTYIVHIEGVIDLAGNVMSEPFEWTFDTGL